MDIAKTLNNIEPYNDLFFKNCFYNSLFSVLFYYDKSILPFLSNSTPIYKLMSDDKKISLYCDYNSYLEDNILLRRMGIREVAESNIDTDILIEKIKNTINNDKPILVNVDCFYMPIRSELFQKQHWGHIILIYGYDDMNRIFSVIEQINHNSLTYRKMELSYEDLVNAYRGYINLTSNYIQEPSYREYELIDHNYGFTYQDFRNDFIENIHLSKEAVAEGHSLLQAFIKEKKYIFMDEAILKENANSLIFGLNSIINTKKVEKYKLERIFKDRTDLVKSINEIENKWNTLRYRIAKFMYSSIYKKEEFTIFEAMLEIIYEDEQIYFQTILNEKL